ncbi:MAG: RsmE family RNA methyltransferase [Chloroflexota bacterium]
MKQHRFFVSAGQIQGEMVSFSPEQSHQLRSVLRIRAGDRVRVFDGSQLVDRIVEIVSVSSGRVVEYLPQAAEPRTRLVVYPALLQRGAFEPVLQKLTEIGAASIVPLLTARGLVRDAPDDRRLTRWRTILREAVEQCGRGVLPDLQPALPFFAAVARAVSEGTVLVAYEGEKQQAVQAGLAGAQTTVSLFVGPEGGFAPEEVVYARQAGARLVTLGSRVLRSETASPLLAGLVLYELGDLSSPRDDA